MTWPSGVKGRCLLDGCFVLVLVLLAIGLSGADGITAEICANGEPPANLKLDIFCIGFDGKNLLLITSKKTGYMVYEEPLSSLNLTDLTWHLGTPPVPMKEKWPKLVEDTIFKGIDALPAEAIFPFTMITDSKKMPFLSIYTNRTSVVRDNTTDKIVEYPGLSFNLMSHQVIPIKSERYNDTVQEYFSSSTHNVSVIRRRSGGDPDLELLNYQTNPENMDDIFFLDNVMFTLCNMSDRILVKAYAAHCTDTNHLKWHRVKGILLDSISFNPDKERSKHYVLFDTDHLATFEFTHSSPLESTKVKRKNYSKLFTCPPLKPGNGTPGVPTTAGNKSKRQRTTWSSTEKKALILFILAIVMAMIIAILVFIAIYCLFCVPGKKEEKKDKAKSGSKTTKGGVGKGAGKSSVLAKSSNLQAAKSLIKSAIGGKDAGKSKIRSLNSFKTHKTFTTTRSKASTNTVVKTKGKSNPKSPQLKAKNGTQAQKPLKLYRAGSDNSIASLDLNRKEKVSQSSMLSKFCNQSSLISRKESDLIVVPMGRLGAGSKSKSRK